jgi:hypothetical protein
MAPQIVRLAIASAVVVGAFIVFRMVAVPDGFGETGFHRKEAMGLVASAEMKHAGRQVCLECHSDLPDHTPHFKKGVGCETCHGAAKAHTEDPEKVKPRVPSKREDCARCHDMIVGRPEFIPQVNVKEHNPGEPCMTCHTVHEEATK